MAKKAGTIPFRLVEGKVWVCLVSSRKRKEKFVLPKGTVRSCENFDETARRETYEEAGLKGRMSLKGIKIRAKSASGGKHLNTIKFFPFEVTAVEKKWPEKKSRERLWVSLKAIPSSKLIKRDLDVLRSRRFRDALRDCSSDLAA